MVGADVADFERVRPLLEAMGNTIHHCGGVGTGTRTKLVNNYLAVVSCQLNAEALALSQRFGLSLEKTLEVLYGTTAFNGQLKIAWPAKVLAGDIEPGFTIDLAHKDLSLIIEAANAAKVPMPIAAAAREAFSTARARGFGRRISRRWWMRSATLPGSRSRACGRRRNPGNGALLGSHRQGGAHLRSQSKPHVRRHGHIHHLRPRQV